MSAKSFRRALILTPFFLIGLLLLAPESIDPDPAPAPESDADTGPEPAAASTPDESNGTAEPDLAPEDPEDRELDAEQF